MAAFPHGFVRFGPTSAAKEWMVGIKVPSSRFEPLRNQAFNKNQERERRMH